eukprot:CAMPEP_0197028060 /NCGR_PEP_ID=MMETSP1384-20130603/7857_1 /TAXON_ID=29189 /ORGANISM="Ammonia sp." /LENGTH=403 /DNA_ID=CAMNT_0042457003 /DNA_START=25 /DNA_END=1236 /DNA_ORIENTATION=+
MNPIKIQKNYVVLSLAIFLLVLFFVLALIAVLGSMGTNESCSGIKVLLIIEPIWLFIYYRLYSILLIKLMECLTCKSAEHGIGYAIFHYFIWTTIGHPYVCFGPFIILNVIEMMDIFNEQTCTSNTELSDTQQSLYNLCFIICTIIFIIMVAPAGIVVLVKNHKDVKFQMEWKEQSATQREKAISNAMKTQTETFVYSGPNDMSMHHNASLTSVHNNSVHNNNNNNNNHNINMSSGSNVALGTLNEAASNDREEEEANAAPPMANNIDTARESSVGEMPDLGRQDTEEQLRMAIAASIATATEEEQKRSKGADNTKTSGAAQTTRRGSVSMTGFWARGQQISTAFLGTLFRQSDFECIVCYEDYEVGQEIAKLKCNHHLHKKCAKDWLAQNPTCPVCRVNVMR